MNRHLSSAPGERVTASADRCDHDLLHCVKCGTAYPGRNYHWPHQWTPRYGREWLQPLAGRTDRRAAGRTATRFRGAKRRANTEGHPLGLPTSYGRTIWPSADRDSDASRHYREVRDARRRERAFRRTRAERLADYRRSHPGATRAQFRAWEADRRRTARRTARSVA